MLQFLYNRFETATRGSFRKMLILITDHLSRLLNLSSDPEIQDMFNLTSPVKEDYEMGYGEWLAVKGSYEGKTLQFNNMLDELRSSKIYTWEATIMLTFPRKSPEFVALLPDGHAPFYEGPYEVRISQVYALASRLNNYPALAALQAEVAAYHALLISTRNEQQQLESALKNSSVLLHKNRVTVARRMYTNLGILMGKHANSPADIEQYFELELLKGGSGGEAPDDGEEEPQVEVVIAMNSKQTPPDPFNMTVSGKDGTDVTANYGDGTTETKTESDSGPTVFSYLHSAAGNYGMQLISLVVGFLEFYAPDCKLSAINIAEGINLRVLDLMNNMLTSFFLPLSCVDMLNLQLNNNELDQASVNQVLMQLAANGLLNGSVNLGGGSNAAPSGQGIAAKNLLISRGWTVVTN